MRRVVVLCLLLVTLAFVLVAGPIAVAPADPEETTTTEPQPPPNPPPTVTTGVTSSDTSSGTSSDTSSGEFGIVDWPEAAPPDKVWTFSFSSPVDVLTVTRGRFVLLDASGGKLDVTMTTALDGLSVAVRPVQDLAPGDYRLQVLPGLLDTSRRAIQEPIQVNFSVTAESTARAQEDEAALQASAGGPSLFGMMNSNPVDFAISSADIEVPALVSPGPVVSVRVTVHNQSPGKGLAGGSVFRVLFNGRAVDEVPFYIPAGLEAARLLLPFIAKRQPAACPTFEATGIN